MTNIYNEINANRRTGGLFIDIKKAFDTLDHGILLQKMHDAGIRGVTSNWFKSYLSERTQCVKVGLKYSEFKIVDTGVPQGSVLGPILFLMYINDLCNFKFNGHLTAFADDVALSYSDYDQISIAKDVQKDLYFIRKWFDYNGLELSEKTKFMFFDPSNCYAINLKLYYLVVDCLKQNCNCLITEQVSSIKYLGVTFDKYLKWYYHINDLVRVLRYYVSKLYFIRHKCPSYFQVMLYNALVGTKLNYGLICWGGAHKTTLNPAVLLQKKLIRIIAKKIVLSLLTPYLLILSYCH